MVTGLKDSDDRAFDLDTVIYKPGKNCGKNKSYCCNYNSSHYRSTSLFNFHCTIFCIVHKKNAHLNTILQHLNFTFYKTQCQVIPLSIAFFIIEMSYPRLIKKAISFCFSLWSIVCASYFFLISSCLICEISTSSSHSE